MAKTSKPNNNTMATTNKLTIKMLPVIDIISTVTDNNKLNVDDQKLLRPILTRVTGDKSLFSESPITRNNTTLNLQRFESEDQFSLHCQSNYFCETLTDTKRYTTQILSPKKDLEHNASLMEHYEMILPYYEMDHIFEGYAAFLFRLSAKSCSSTSLNIKVEVYFCREDIKLDPKIPNSRGQSLIRHNNEVTWPAPISPVRKPLAENNIGKKPFVFQSGKSWVQNFMPSVVDPDHTQVLVDSSTELVNVIKQLAESLSEKAGGINSSVSETLNEFKEKFSALEPQKHADYAKDYMNKFAEEYSVDNISNHLCKNVSIIAVIVTGTYALGQRTRESYFAFAGSVVASLYFNKDLIFKMLLDWVSFYTKPQPLGEAVAQSGMVADDYFSLAITGLTSLVLVQTPGFKVPTEILKSLAGFTRAKQTMKDIFDFFVRTMDSILTYFETGINMPAWAKYINVEQELIKEFLVECDAVGERIKRGDFQTNHINYEIIKDLRTKGRQIGLQLKGLTPSQNSVLTSTNVWLAKIVQKFHDSNFCQDGLRQQPVTIMLAGTPGTGKTQTMEWLARGLVKKTIAPELLSYFEDKPSDFVYPRNAEGKFMEGYKGQTVVTIDDVLQGKDMAGNPDSEAMNVIRFSDETAYTCNMGALENKGNTYFTSKFLIMTSNVRVPHCESIRDQGAFNRRCHLVAECFPRDDVGMYKTDEQGTNRFVLNPSMINRMEDGTTWIDPRKLFVYKQYCLWSGRYTGVTWSFDAMFNKAVDLYLLFKNRFRIKTEKLIEFCSEIIPLHGMDEYKRYKLALERSQNNTFYDCKEDPEQLDQEEYYSEKAHHQFTDQTAMIMFKRKEEYDLDDILEMIEMDTPQFEMSEVSSSGRKTVVSQIGGLAERSNVILDRVIDLPSFSTADITAIDWDWFFTGHEIPRSEKYMIVHNLARIKAIIMRDRIELAGYNSHGILTLIKGVLPLTMKDKMLKPMSEQYLNYLVFKMDPETSDFKAFCNNIRDVGSFVIGEWKIMFNELLVAARSFVSRNFTTFGLKFRDSMLWIKANYHLIVGPLIAFTALYKFFSKNEIPVLTQSLPQKNLSKEKTVKFLKKGNDNTAQAQMASGRDKQGDDLINKYIYKNCYEMIVDFKDRDKHISFGFITFLKDNLAIIPYHFITQIAAYDDEGMIDDDSIITFRLNKLAPNPPSFTLTVKQFRLSVRISQKCETADLAILEIPRNLVRVHADITHLIPPIAMINRMKDLNICLTVPKLFNKQQGSCVAKPLNNFPVKITADSEEIYAIRSGYKYYLSTECGDCGGWLSLQDPNFPYKLIGFHAAGDCESWGFATAICLEDIMDMIKQCTNPNSGDHLDQAYLAYNPMPGDEEPDIPIVSQGQFIEIRRIEKIPRGPEKNNISKTELHDTYFKSKTLPSVVKAGFVNGVYKDPMEKALLKYCLPHVHLKEDDIGIASEMYWNTLLNFKFSVDKRIYTFEEAILGLDGEKHFSSLSRKTSAGYPYNTLGFVKKFTHFGIGDTYDLNTEACKALKELVITLINKARKGIRMEHIFHDNIKAERRAIQKVLDFLSRMFSSCTLPLTIATRMYFGAFSLWFTKNRIQNGSASGVNAYGTEWHDIYEELMNKGSHTEECVGAGDFKGFDGSQKSQIHWLIKDLIDRWYNDGPENCEIRRILWLDLTNSFHLNGHSVVMWPGSLPSGHPLTLIVNTMYNNIAFRYAWYRSSVVAGMMKTPVFDENVYFIAMGDDNLFSVKPEFRHIFNEITISEYLAEIGLTYTLESKGKALVALRKINEVEFLKRKFRYSPEAGRCVAPLQLDVVLEVPMWTDSDSPLRTLIDNVNFTMRELSLHGKETFNEWCPKIVEAMRRECDLAPSNVSYILNLNDVLNRDAPF